MNGVGTGMQGPAEETPIVLGPREQLFHLLAEAAEIEHTLMCSYLYAAFSLKRAGTGGLREQEGAAVERWRKEIMGVAIEEMTHLLLVSNLSIAIGGRPHFGRPNFPVDSGYFPSGVVVKLTPFNADTLQHLIFLERPRGIPHEDGEGFEPEEEYRREEAYFGLMPSVQDYTTVGRLYDALRANLISSAERLGEAALFIGDESAQVGPDVVDLEGVAKIDALDAALHAIDTIVAQGEGSPADREDSHYQRFLSIRKEYRALRAANPGFEPAWPAAESPVMRRPPEPDGKIFVDAPAAAMVLDLGNAIYNLLLRCLVQAFGRQGEAHAGNQRRYFDAAIPLMHALSLTASTLVEMPASASHPGTNAGLSFTILRSVEPLLAGPAETVLLQERIREVHNVARSAARTIPALAPLDASLAAVAQALTFEVEAPTAETAS
jgi:hypothetical protein